jgi:predicted DCC family thiol-disulfide oxidoreductase YuxK
MEPDLPIIFFDGICNFCNYWVQFSLKHNSKNHLYFSALQSEYAKNFFIKNGLEPDKLYTVIFFRNGIFYTQSSAACRICRELNWPWKIGYAAIAIPKFIRDFFYNLVARNRYRWFGKKESCMVPEIRYRQRFLE